MAVTSFYEPLEKVPSLVLSFTDVPVYLNADSPKRFRMPVDETASAFNMDTVLEETILAHTGAGKSIGNVACKIRHDT